MTTMQVETLEMHYPVITFLINGINIVFHVGDNVLLEEDRLRAKLADFGSAVSCEVSYVVENTNFEDMIDHRSYTHNFSGV